MSGSRLFQRVWNLLAFGSLNAVNDAGTVQTAQALIGYAEIRDGVPVVQHFGFASNAPTGSDLVMLSQAGQRANSVIIGTNHQPTRPQGQASGESSIFNAFGMSVHMSAGGIVVNSGGKPVVINGDVHVTGAVIAGYGGSDQVGVQTHQHAQSADSHGDTEQPTSAPTAGT